MKRKSRSGKRREPWPAFYLIACALAAAAIISVLALDFINWTTGERSYVFRTGAKKPAPAAKVQPPPARPLGQALEDGLIASGVARDSLRLAEAPDGLPLVEVRLPAKAYPAAEKELEKWLRREKIRIEEKKKQAVDDGTEYRWLARRADGQAGWIQFFCPAETAVAPAPAARTVRGQVALIMDDMGNNPDALEALLGLKEPVTISVLPYSRFAAETARTAHDNNLEVLVHVPLESLNNHDAKEDSQGLILASMSSGEIVQAVEDAVARVPYADGVNNHMGSKFTADRALMRTLLEPLKRKGLFFVDSRTTAQTVGYGEALRLGVPSVERDVFLDADADRSLIKSRLIELFRAARKKGRAVGICHPFPETIRVLKSTFAQFADYDLEVVPVSRLVHK
jgi:uncharacterized protein